MERKVLVTASTYSHIRNFHLPYLQRFRQAGWQVHVAVGGTKMDLPGADAVFHLPLEKSLVAPDNIRATMQLRRQIRREGYDLIVAHTTLAAFFTRLAVLGLKRRPAVIHVVHGYLFDGGCSPAKRQAFLAAERVTAPVTDLVLTMNREDYEIACKHKLGRRVANVPGVGVDFARLDAYTREDGALLRQELGIDPNAFVLFYAADFSKNKSQSVLIRAMELLDENVVLVLVGEGRERERCKELARERNVDGRVLFPGYVSDMPLWCAMADAAVPSSRKEGLPFNVMEAMYCGLPVVASAVKGHVDLVRHEETGLLYPYGDHVACARAISRLVNDPEFARDLGENGKRSVLDYDLNRVEDVLFGHYESCIEPVGVH